MTTSVFPGGSDGKASACNAGDLGSIPGLGRSPGEGNGNPLQYSCLENPTDGGAWLATVHGVAKSRTRLSNFTFTFKVYSRLIRRYRDFFFIYFCPHACIKSPPSTFPTRVEWHICYINEPSCTHHPMSTVYIRAHSWCCIFCGFVQMCNDVFLS